MKVLFATSEVAPFAKSGGLGDVSGSLPKIISRKGIDIRVIMPLYADIPNEYKDLMKEIGKYEINLNWRIQQCKIFSLERDGVIHYFIKNDYYFGRKGLYGYFDEAERFLFFSRAILEFIPKLDFWPDIIHCNDWQTAIVPYLLNKQYRPHFINLKTVLTIHNIKYQGVYGFNTLYELLGLSPDDMTGDIEYNGNANIMKAGICNADAVTTVSPTYAKELEYEYFGEGLHGVIKENSYKMTGILNGIDYDVHSPSIDENIYVKYTRSIKKKEENKRFFLEEEGLEYNVEKPLVGIISRLDELKGIDLITYVIYEIMKLGINLVVLGTGDKKYEDVFRHIGDSFPNNTSINIAFDTKLASKIYAASDVLLMPSRVEPCGLAQIIALKYGTAPLVRKTGGLNDTITKYNPATGLGNGFVFNSYNAHEMLSELNRAVCIYKENKNLWGNLVMNAFKSKFDWSISAEKYIELYNKIQQ
jgi:starch synthase